MPRSPSLEAPPPCAALRAARRCAECWPRAPAPIPCGSGGTWPPGWAALMRQAARRNPWCTWSASG
eukprot:12922487-Alexandrium_andersonii.AAC.1